MAIKLKQSLRLADNISAFDPQTPLNLSPDMSSHISIPIADKSAVAGGRVGKAQLVSGIPGHNGRAVRFGGAGIETFTTIMTTAGYRLNLIFSQPIVGFFVYMDADDASNRIDQSLPENDLWAVRQFQREIGYWCLARTEHLHFIAGTTVGTSEIWVTGVY